MANEYQGYIGKGDYWDGLNRSTKLLAASRERQQIEEEKKRQSLLKQADKYLDSYKDETGAVNFNGSVFTANGDNTYTDANGQTYSAKDLQGSISTIEKEKQAQKQREEERGPLGAVADFTAQANDAAFGGAIRGGANIINSIATGFNGDETKKRTEEFMRSIGQSSENGQSNLAKGTDKDSSAGKAGSITGTVGRQTAEIAGSLVIPGAGALKIAKVLSGAKKLATVGGIDAGIGAAYGATQSMSEGKNGDEILKDAAIGGAIGGAAPAVVSGAVKGFKALRNAKNAQALESALTRGDYEDLPQETIDSLNQLAKSGVKPKNFSSQVNEIIDNQVGKEFDNLNQSAEAGIKNRQAAQQVDDIEKIQGDQYLKDRQNEFSQMMVGNKLSEKPQLRLEAGQPARTLDEVNSELNNLVTGNHELSSNPELARKRFGELQQERAVAEQNKNTTDFVMQKDSEMDFTRPAEESNATMAKLENGDIPETMMKDHPVIKNTGEIIGSRNLPEAARQQAGELAQHRIIIQAQLNDLMTDANYQKAAQELDDMHAQRSADIQNMPPQRQEFESQKLEDEYGQQLDELNQRRADDAPNVERYQNVLNTIKANEKSLIDSTNAMILDHPEMFKVPNENLVEDKLNTLAQERKIGELNANVSSDSNKAINGSVENGVAPSQSMNPTVQKAAQDVKDIGDMKYSDTNYRTTPADKFINSSREVLEKFGEPGQLIAKVLDGAVDKIGIRNNQVARQAIDWQKRAGGKGAMREIAKALDNSGDFSQLNAKQQKVFTEVQQWFKDYAESLGLPPEARIQNYLPHIFNDNPPSVIDLALAKLRSGVNEKGAALTKAERDEASKIVSGVDYETIAMIEKQSMYKVKNGFLEKRKGKDGYSFELGDIITTYANAAHNKMYLEPAYSMVKEQSKLLSHNQNEYLARVIHAVNGKRTDALGDDLNNMLEGIFKSPGLYDKASVKARKLVYDATMGLNVGSAVRNLQQGANTYAKLGEKYYGIGVKGAFASLKKDSDLYNELLSEGVFTNNFGEFVRQGELGGKAESAMWYMFNNVEHFNRATAYVGAKSRYLDKAVKNSKGAFTHENIPDDVMAKARRAGREMSRKTQFEFGALDVPVGFNSTTAKNFLQLQTYNIQQVKFLKNMIAGDTDSLFVKGDKGYKITKTGAMQIGRLIGANMLFIGTAGAALGMKPTDMLPFYQEGEALFDTFTGKKDRSTEIVPRSPLLQLLTGGGGKTGLLQAGGDPLGFAANTASLVVPGAGQAKKTFEGVQSVVTGESKNASGKTRFLQDQDPVSAAQAALFGQYTTGAGKEWLRGGMNTLSESQTKKVDKIDDQAEKQQLVDFYNMSKSLGKQSARDEIDKVYKERGTNAAFRKTQEYNQKVDDAIAEYRKTYDGKLPLELSKQINSLKINYGKLTLDNE